MSCFFWVSFFECVTLLSTSHPIKFFLTTYFEFLSYNYFFIKKKKCSTWKCRKKMALTMAVAFTSCLPKSNRKTEKNCFSK